MAIRPGIDTPPNTVERAFSGGTTLEPGVLGRIAGAIRYAIKGPKDFFGPGTPIAAVAQEETHGRAWDFPVGYNLTTQPRSGEAVSFEILRALGDNYDLVRLAIETRKDQMGKLRWEIQRADDGTQDTKAKLIQAQLKEPDNEHDFGDWLRMLLEDLLVIDAPAVYIWPTKGGDVFALEQVDGATIKRVLDRRGRTPAPPKPGEAFDPTVHTAYQQILKGLPATSYHANELIYKPRNPRRHKVYGYSPVEQLLLIVNLGLRRQTHQLAFYTSGNVPEMLMAAPAGWSLDQIDKFQKYWDTMLTGDLAARRQLRMVPSDLKPLPLRPETSLFDAFDEWIARVVCYCFSLPPTAFTKQVNRATAETAQEAALTEGLAPLMEWVVSFMNRIIRKAWQTDDYVFAWSDETSMDPLVQAQVDEIYVRNKIRLVNEVREDHDWEAKPELDEAQLAPPPVPAPFGHPPVAPIDDPEAKVAPDPADVKPGETGKASVAELAEALGKMVETGIPLNQALKAAGFDFTVPGGDVGLVSAARIPLSVAGDASSLLPEK